MLTRELPSQTLPYLHFQDKVYQALQLMSDHHVTHLPVVEEEKYVGIVSEDNLLHAEDENAFIETLQSQFGNVSVREGEHFLKAVQMAAENSLSVIPVVNDDNELTGTVVYDDLLKHASAFMSLKEPGGLIVIEMDSNQYSFSEISKLVELNEAQITQLNTSNDGDTGLMQVTIRINKPEVSDIVATFQRYEYNVKYYFGEELYTNELRSNFDNLMNYLKL